MELVEPARFHFLVAEVLHGFEVEQAVYRLGVGIIVGLVHFLADGNAPVAGAHREPRVKPDYSGNDGDIAEAIGPPEDDGGQRKFEDGGQRVQDGEADDDLDALGAALDDA
jgi:hypothetical protein